MITPSVPIPPPAPIFSASPGPTVELLTVPPSYKTKWSSPPGYPPPYPPCPPRVAIGPIVDCHVG